PKIINTQNVADGVRYEEIAEEMIGNGSVGNAKDPTEAFKDQLQELAKSLNLSFDSPRKSASARRSPTTRTPKTAGISPYGVKTPGTKSSPARQPTPFRLGGRGDDDAVEDERDEHSESSSSSGEDDKKDDGDRTTPRKSPARESTAALPAFLVGATVDRLDSRTPPRDHLSELDSRTMEERKHEQVKSVMKSMGGGQSAIFSIEEEKLEDQKSTMLEEIDSLRAALEEDDIKGLDRIPKVDHKNTFEEVENVLKILRLKMDRTRYCSFADEFIIWGAQGLEELFDGRRVWFNRWQPDLTGW